MKLYFRDRWEKCCGMNYLILAFFCILTAWFIFKGKNPVITEIVYFVVAPYIKIGSLTFDSSYFYIFFLMVLLVIRENGKLPIRKLNGFALLMGLWIVFYTVGWLINGNTAAYSGFIISVLGLIRNVAAIYVAMLSFDIKSTDELDSTIGKGLSILVVMNVVAVLLQRFMPMKMYDICYQLYYGATSRGYTNYKNINSWGSGFYKGRYYRYFGLFDTPMNFSCFLILVMAFVVIQYTTDRKIFKYPKITVSACIILGFFAQCKVFFLMLPVLLVMYIIFNLKKISLKGIVFGLILALMMMMFFLNIDAIAKIEIFRYLRYLKDPLEAFSTRFGSDDQQGYITGTLQVAMEHPVFGVGPVSIEGEHIADSSYVVLLHNGGFFAVGAMAVFYIRLLISDMKNRYTWCSILLVSLLLMGISRNLLIFGGLLTISLYYININLELVAKNKPVLVKDNA